MVTSARYPLGVGLAISLVVGASAVSVAQSPSVAPDPSAGGFPVSMTNCGFDVAVEAAPTRAVSMNQGATEIMLSLGLEGSMVGTAYLDDMILPELADAYAAVPVLSPEYPSQEVLLGEEPDFVYGSYASAFGPEAAGDRQSLADLGIGSYVSPVACEDRSLRPAELTYDDVYGEIRDIGRIFGVSDRAEALVAQMEADLEAATAAGTVGDGLTAIWYDSGTEIPTVGSCCGAPGMIMDAVGLSNAFEDLPGSWGDATWEAFVAADPDVIVLADASWDLAEDRKAFLAADPATSTMRAVQEERYVVLPFSATTAGIRNVQAAETISEAIGAFPVE